MLSHSPCCLFSFFLVSFTAQTFYISLIHRLIFLLLLVFSVPYLGIHGQVQGHEDVLLFPLLSVL